MSFCIELFCVVTLQYQILVRIVIAYFIIEKKKAAPQPWQAIAQRFCSTGICNYIPYILAFFTITLSPFSNCSLETPLNPSPTCSVLYPQPFDFRSFVCISMLVIIVSNTPPYIVKSFFLIFQGIFSSISQMNEPRRWTFLCIWYENRGVGVHKIKRHHFRSTWPCVYPPIYGSEPPVSTRITRISAGS